MRVGIAADHGGFELKQQLADELRKAGFEVEDYGARRFDPEDDYPDFVVPLARGLGRGDVERGIAVCGSGVGACMTANRVRGVRACVCHDHYSAGQGVEHDAMNLLCLGARVVGVEVARDLVRAFLDARFSGEARHERRLEKVRELERSGG